MLESDVLYANYSGPGVVRVKRSKHQSKAYIESKVKDYALRNNLPWQITVRNLDHGVLEISWKYEELMPTCKHSYRLNSVEHFIRTSAKEYNYRCKNCDHIHTVLKFVEKG